MARHNPPEGKGSLRTRTQMMRGQRRESPQQHSRHSGDRADLPPRPPDHVDPSILQEMEANMRQMRESHGQAVQEVMRLRQQLDAKEESFRKLKIHALQLSDFINASEVQVEEEKNNLRRQTEAEARGYRMRHQNMSALVAQLRQDVLEEKGHAEDLKQERDKLTEEREKLCNQVLESEKNLADARMSIHELQQKVNQLTNQRTSWEEAEASWAERVERAEALVLEMEKDCAETTRRNDDLKRELQTAQIKIEELQLQGLHAQRREIDVRQALAEASEATAQFNEMRKECEEIRLREQEHLDLITELKLEKQKMMQHLQAGIRERQDIIDTLCMKSGHIDANPQLQLKILEVESLREELSSCMRQAEEESATLKEYIEILKQKHEHAETKLKEVRNDNLRLQAELELTREGIQDVHTERERAHAIRGELEKALRDVSVLKQELKMEWHAREAAVQERVETSRQTLQHSPSHSP